MDVLESWNLSDMTTLVKDLSMKQLVHVHLDYN